MRSRILPVVTVVCTLFTLACGESPVAPDPVPAPVPANTPPVITAMAVRESGYRTGSVTAAVSDSDGTVASAVVDWGDGTSETLTSGLAAISRSHKYGRAQAYTISVRATDNRQGTTQDSRSLSIHVPPQACIGIEIREVCASSTADFRNMVLAIKAGDISLAAITVTDSAPSITVPLALGFGRLTVGADFNTGRLSVTGEVCPVPYLVCQSTGTRYIQL